MNKPGPVLAWESVSEDLTLFKALNSEQRLKILGAMVRQDLVRGEILVAQGDPSDARALPRLKNRGCYRAASSGEKKKP